MKFTAAVLRDPHARFSIETLEMVDELLPTEVLVKVVATGLCHTDLAVRDQHLPVSLPVILGHEGAGVVTAVGSAVTHVGVGDHVVLAPASCRQCVRCVSGHPSYCDELMSLNMAGVRSNGSHAMCDAAGKPVGSFFFGQSSFGNYALVRGTSVVKVPNDIPLEILGPLGCGLQTGAGTVLNVLRAGPGDSIAVFGVGPVGLAALMAAKVAGCTTIIAVDVNDERLLLARDLGATHVVNSKREKPSEVILKSICRGGIRFAVDTTARSDVVNEALRSLRALGRCAMVGIASTATLEIDNMAIFGGRSLETVVEGDSIPEVFIPRLIDLYRAGLFPFDRLLQFYDLADIQSAVEDSERGKTLKAVIRMPHSEATSMGSPNFATG
jgi:aryl-alcohol dehydrogenase